MRKAFYDTRVPAARTRGEIDTMLQKHDVEAVRWTEFTDRILLEFKMPEGSFAIGVSFAMGDSYPEAQQRRQVWRALHWHIKARLEAVDFGLGDMVHAFLPYLITGPNRTLGDDVMERVADRTLGADIPLLPEGRA